ncbi:hypothetical protein FN846DRAFT_922208 [Sphaerosporella brunnea]|uniref:Cupin 2 conserved barrel domain-containing protein n=1 Tax=Sphaerosporella brunnea TaxID=1250544 RepID=A0A5J5EKU3_9PEZI|nr:hypothetical protein FN846DRAFT_922208 [Sphaerosporella brunnea]
MPQLTRPQAESAVRQRGYANITYWEDPAGTYYPPHTHPVANTHLIMSGSMRVKFPQRQSDEREVEFGGGEWVDVNKDETHEVWVGERGCKMVIGEKSAEET